MTYGGNNTNDYPEIEEKALDRGQDLSKTKTWENSWTFASQEFAVLQFATQLRFDFYCVVLS